jgi:hypothetical protein
MGALVDDQSIRGRPRIGFLRTTAVHWLCLAGFVFFVGAWAVLARRSRQDTDDGY